MTSAWMQINIICSDVAQVLFWISVSVLFYVYIGYPALLGFLALFRRRPQREPGYCPSLSVLIAAYNEEASIGRKIRETLAAEYPAGKLEIIVVSDGSTDRTDEIVKSFAGSRVRLLRITDRRGKTHAQNEGAKECRNEVIVFSDATTVYHPKALLYLACNYEDPRVGAVSGRYKYFDPEGQSPTGWGSIVFWNYENLIKKLQSRIWTITGCSGCIYSVRRDLYTPLDDDVISDLVQPLHVVKKGRRVIFEDRALAYEETTKSAGEEFGMRVRVVTRGIRGVLSVPELLEPWKHGWASFQLLSHKVLRWMVPFFLILLFASSALLANRSAIRCLFLLQALFYVFGLLSVLVPLHRQWKPLGVPLYFCTLNAAALFSVIELFRGRKYVVWETVRKSAT